MIITVFAGIFTGDWWLCIEVTQWLTDGVLSDNKVNVPSDSKLFYKVQIVVFLKKSAAEAERGFAIYSVCLYLQHNIL